MSTYYFLPTRNVFGMGASQEAGKLMRSLGGPASLKVPRGLRCYGRERHEGRVQPHQPPHRHQGADH